MKFKDIDPVQHCIKFDVDLQTSKKDVLVFVYSSVVEQLEQI